VKGGGVTVIELVVAIIGIFIAPLPSADRQVQLSDLDGRCWSEVEGG